MFEFVKKPTEKKIQESHTPSKLSKHKQGHTHTHKSNITESIMHLDIVFTLTLNRTYNVKLYGLNWPLL